MEMNNVTFVDGYSTPQNAQAGNKVLGKDDFLRLLVTKLSYQDPLNPIDDEDFVAQLAQFSSLEQMENMNKNLENDLQWNYLLSQTISNTMSTSLIGRKVTAETTILHLDTGGSSDIRLNLKEPAARLEVTIYDKNGTAIRSITQDNPGKGDIVVHWDGLDDQGVQAVAGDYQVEVTAVDLSGEEFKPGMYVEGKVDRVVYNDGIAYLSVNGQSVPLAAVREVEEG
jgi:flagellar basal-body rod modification protein FlgD